MTTNAKEKPMINRMVEALVDEFCDGSELPWSIHHRGQLCKLLKKEIKRERQRCIDACEQWADNPEQPHDWSDLMELLDPDELV